MTRRSFPAQHATPAALARMFDVTRTTVYRWAHMDGFPEPIPGTTVRNVQHVVQWLEKRGMVRHLHDRQAGS